MLTNIKNINRISLTSRNPSSNNLFASRHFKPTLKSNILWRFQQKNLFSTESSDAPQVETTPKTQPTWKILEDKLLAQIPQDKLPKMLSPHPTRRYATLKKVLNQIKEEEQRKAEKIVYPEIQLPKEKQLIPENSSRNQIFFPNINVKVQRNGFADTGKKQKFTIKIRPNINKRDLKSYIESVWGFNISKINTTNYEAKWKQVQGRWKKKESGYKKAVITVEPTNEEFRVNSRTGKPMFKRELMKLQIEQMKKEQKEQRA